ncbi:MAG: alpha/beta fold hydrolase [Actinomycetota bacterium]|nr:alpha/beta fold hydrolase [Actinomycetota bacterium]
MKARDSEKSNRKDGASHTTPQWWYFSPLVPALAGTLWLWMAARGGTAVLLGASPGALLLGTGLSVLLWDAGTRTLQYMALSSGLGVVLSVPVAVLLGPIIGIVLGASSAASFLAAGYLALDAHPCPSDAPAPEVSPGFALRAATDEVMMCLIILTTWPVAVGPVATRIRREASEAYPLFEERGWLEEPATYHRDPPPLKEPEIQPLSDRGWEIERLTFDSLYEPRAEEPGCERWLARRHDPTAYAWTLRHPGEERPWLICVHGIRVGSLKRNFSLFRPDYLHEELGLNILMPVLPTHGPRRRGPISGERTLSGDVMDALHTGEQAIWDLRRLVSWLRKSEGAPAVGALGHSLGGYMVALLASLERDLDCAVTGNPAVDPAHLFWTNAPAMVTYSLSAEGMSETLEELLRPVSPLALTPLIPLERRAIFAGVIDGVVPPAEASSLWRHWEKPRIGWYQGSHDRFLRAPEARRVLEDTLHAAGML